GVGIVVGARLGPRVHVRFPWPRQCVVVDVVVPALTTPSATARRKSTILGPHCEAVASDSDTTCPCLTAFMTLNPGREAKDAAPCLQHSVSARNTKSGSLLIRNSAESWG